MVGWIVTKIGKLKEEEVSSSNYMGKSTFYISIKNLKIVIKLIAYFIVRKLSLETE
ncbi:hypothetical protein RG963_15610 [Methanosarcina sp. Z-7115]|uniref:Mobile element protein n=1 Tax=Methanosarcina baikalica TaxID=3073890 RepID=A0ABU2D5B3_9EURY|nr:hypothetical protein [Methanosarcina sp. Z-7115]MDR7667176.1 hypothetical protein [Methanosarcina sp. Z-7115]